MPLTPVLIDAATRRQHIHQKAVDAVQNVFPIQTKNMRVEIEDVQVTSRDYSSREQRDALLRGQTLQEPLKGTLILKDETGKTLERKPNTTLAQLPYFTPRHTFIVDGNEYSVSHQRRVRPGVYTRVRRNEELEAAFNLGKGENFRINMDPAKGHLFLQYGATHIPLYPVLQQMGVSDAELAKNWGQGVVKTNREAFEKKTSQAVGKLYERLVPAYQQEAKTPEQQIQQIKDSYKRTSLDPSVTERTLGTAYKQVTPDAMVQASRKLLDVHRQGIDTDDRDSLSFQTLYGVDDFIKERIELEGRNLHRKVRFKSSKENELSKLVPTSPFTRSIRSFMTTAALSAIPTQINPMEIIDSAVRVTNLGEGGISSERAVPAEARNLHHTQLGIIDPGRTPESFRAGIDLRTSIWTKRDEQGRMHTLMRNAKTGKLQDVPVRTLENSVVAFARQEKQKNNISAMQHGNMVSVPRKDVDYDLPHPTFLFSPATNTVPMPESMQGNRLIMASKYATQALPLLEREAPLVQVASYNPGRTFEQELADLIVPRSPTNGIIQKIDEDYIYIKPTPKKKADTDSEWPCMAPIDHVSIDAIEPIDGEKHGAAPLIKIPYDNNFPLSSKTYLHNDLTVKKGDTVGVNQHLANSNYTKDGRLALGRNLNVGYMAYYGLNSNDAVVLSETGAKKMTSEHMYKENMPLDPEITLGKSKHRGQFGSLWTDKQYGQLDDRGIVKVGTTIQPGDPLVLALRKTTPSAEQQLLGRLHKTLATPYREETLVWDHRNEGQIIDVIVTLDRILVLVKTQESAAIGDKISNRAGSKGVVSKIIPDDQMIQTQDGKPLDALLTPAGVVSRVNPSQIIETAVAKVAQKTGKPIVMESMSGKNNVKWARQLLKEHGLTDKEPVYNPLTDKMITGPDGKGIMVGPQYMYKLFKSTETNYSARGIEDYDVNLQPAKGGAEGAKALGRMEINALLAHNARNVLHEASTLKSTKNDEFWRRYQLGQPLPPLKSSFAYDKFAQMLGGAGIQLRKNHDQLVMGPMTDADIQKLSSGALTRATMIREKDFSPEKGGLFDPVITGGTSGNRWSHVNLAEPVLNPVFEDPARRLLGVTQAQLRQLMAQKGGTEVQKRLKALDLAQKEEELAQITQKATGTALDSAIKQLKAVRALRRENLTADQAYVLSKLPVVPPVIRPILPSKGKRDMLIADANYLYRDTMLANDTLADAKRLLPDDDLGQARLHLYDSTRAVFGLDEPTSPQLKGRGAKGFIATIAGQGSPKRGFFHSKVLKLPQDLSGRGTIVPDLTLNMDQIGIPEDMLWVTYGPHLIRRLVTGGYNAVDAKKMVDQRHPTAQEALQREIQERPLILNRAPTLHRHGMLGAYPVSVPGKTIRINPFMEQPIGGDYDGDQQINTVIYALPTPVFMKLDYTHALGNVGVMTLTHTTTLPLLQDHTIFIADLSETPHEALLHTKEHISFYKTVSGLKVLTLDEKTNTLYWQEATGWSVHKDRLVEIVTLSSGKQIVTDDDPRAVYGIDIDTLIWCRRRPVESKRQLVPVINHIPLPNGIEEITHNEISIIQPIPLNQDFGYFIGLMAGNGWVSYTDDVPMQCHFASNDPSLKEAWYKTTNLFLTTTSHEATVITTQGKLGNSKGTARHTISRVGLARLLSVWIGRNARKKHLPAWAFTAPKECKWGILSGLWDTDGSVAYSNAKNKPQFLCNYTTSSLRLAKEIQLLWRTLDITSTITPIKTPKGEPFWCLNVSIVELHKNCQFNLKQPEKQWKIHHFLHEAPPDESTVYQRNKYVPLPEWLATHIRTTLKTHQALNNTDYTSIMKYKKRGYMTQTLARKLLALMRHHNISCSHPQYTQWCALVDTDAFHFEAVKEVTITKQYETGYDLTVPDRETFVSCDGVILSNTLQIHVPVNTKAVQDVKSMTLSNQLFGDKTRSDLMAFPQHESVLGVYTASKANTAKKPRHFKTKQQALDAYNKGEIDVTDPVTIG